MTGGEWVSGGGVRVCVEACGWISVPGRWVVCAVGAEEACVRPERSPCISRWGRLDINIQCSSM